MEYISKNVAAYGQFVLVFFKYLNQTYTLILYFLCVYLRFVCRHEVDRSCAQPVTTNCRVVLQAVT